MFRSPGLIGLAGLALTFTLGACTVKVNSNEPKTPDPAPVAAATTEPAPTASSVPTPAPGKSTAKAEGDSIKVPGNIVFDTGKSTLKEGAGSEVVLEQLKLFLDENPTVTKIRIEGHTDNVGQPTDNLELSGQRALTIKKWLVGKGVKAERLLAVGFGQDKPIASNATEEGKAQNRRTEFKIAEIKGKRYLGMDPIGGGKVFE